MLCSYKLQWNSFKTFTLQTTSHNISIPLPMESSSDEDNIDAESTDEENKMNIL